MNIINNTLYVGELPASDVAAKFGTPVFVYDEDVMRHNYRELAECFSYPKVRVLYACRANYNPRILQILREEGAGVCVSSAGEVLAALAAGFKPAQLLFAGVALSDGEMKLAVSKKIMVSVDSVSQLELYGRLNPKSDFCLSISSGSDGRFGISVSQLSNAVEVAKKYGLSVVGLHQHSSSGISDVGKFLNSMGMLLAAAKNFPELRFVDFGGGFSVHSMPDDKPLSVSDFGVKASSLLSGFVGNYGRELEFLFEAGAYLVAGSCAILCSVADIKPVQMRRFVVLNAGFGRFAVPMARSFGSQIVRVEGADSPVAGKAVVCGSLPDFGDVFTPSEVDMPALKVGDVVAVLNAGAYCYSVLSNYNLRPKPAEILVSGKKMSVIRPAEKLAGMVK